MLSTIKLSGRALVLVAGVATCATASASAAPGHLRPVLAKTVIVSSLRGSVTVEQPHTRRSIRVVGSVALRVGGSVDTRAGIAGVEIATPAKSWFARLSDGSAQVLQRHSGTTTFKLTGALDCGSGAAVAKHRPRRHKPPRHRTLWVQDNGGPFASQGSYAAAGARGTEWITTDYCGRTTVRVFQGVVAVSNFATHRTATVTKGQSYTAAAVSPAAHFRWTPPQPISNGGEFTSISCAPSAFCAAVNNNGDVVTSSNPAGGPTTWRTTNVVSDSGLTSISCPSSQFCAATDDLTADVLVSTNPAGGAGSWQALTLPSQGVLNRVTCTSASFCIAVDSAGAVFTATNPTGGAGAWQQATVIPGGQLNDVSCLGSSLCVAAGAGLATSTDPTAGASAWRSTTAISADSVSCPTTTLCVLAGDTGDVTTTTNPTGGPSAYRHVPSVDHLHPFQPGQDVSCVAGGPCVIVGASGDAITTLDPTGPASAWSTSTIDSTSGLASVSCADAHLCVAVDQSGNALVGTR